MVWFGLYHALAKLYIHVKHRLANQQMRITIQTRSALYQNNNHINEHAPNILKSSYRLSLRLWAWQCDTCISAWSQRHIKRFMLKRRSYLNISQYFLQMHGWNKFVHIPWGSFYHSDPWSLLWSKCFSVSRRVGSCRYLHDERRVRPHRRPLGVFILN